MTEKINEIIQKDETESSKERNTGEGFEISKTSELEKFTKDISKINEAISHDQKINLSDVENIEKTIGLIKVNIGGEEMTIAEAKKIPDLKENIKIWNEIRAGNFTNTVKLNFITPEIAKYLSKHKGIIWLDGLTAISDTAAEYLSKHRGMISLDSLTSLSDKAAEHLSKHKDYIALNSLTTISNTVAEHLSKHNENISLGGLTSISDTIAEHLSKHEGILYLQGLTSISDVAAEHLSRHKNLFVLNKIKQKIDKYKK
jgi:hypothetical protein